MAKSTLLLLSLLILAPAVSADIRVEILGLFKHKALLLIDGQRRLLNVGTTSPEGVTLLAATSKSAQLEWGGRQRSLQVSRQISADYAAPTRDRVIIYRSSEGQYLTQGMINGRSARLLVDTGASVVALNAHEAARLGIDFRGEGARILVATAAGVVAAYDVIIDNITVGEIEVRGVRASVLEGGYPTDILLGMSFLEHVTIKEHNGVMSLEQ